MRLLNNLFLQLIIIILLPLPSFSQTDKALEIVTIVKEGGRVDWSHANNMIAYDKIPKESKYFEVYSRDLEGKNVRCLTCEKMQLPRGHRGNPAWHPSGDYIVFQARSNSLSRNIGKRLKEKLLSSGSSSIRERRETTSKQFQERINPSDGFKNDLWIMNSIATKFWKLFDSNAKRGGVRDAHFSEKGDKLYWVERVSNFGGIMGTWEIKSGNFRVSDMGPTLDNIKSIKPGASQEYYLVNSVCGYSLLFSANTPKSFVELSYDIYKYDFLGGRVLNITDSAEDWDHYATYSPDCKRIIWSSSRNLGIPAKLTLLRSDYWIMDADGSNKRKLTDFNSPQSADYIQGGVAATDFSWNKEGNAIVALVEDNPKKHIGNIILIKLPAKPAVASKKTVEEKTNKQ
jgi:Tol biopolymer transport system component